MKDSLGHDVNYWKDAKKLLGKSLKTCQPQNRDVYTRAIIHAEKKIRAIRAAAMVAIFCLVIGVGGCSFGNKVGEAISALSDDVRAGMQSVSNQ